MSGRHQAAVRIFFLNMPCILAARRGAHNRKFGGRTWGSLFAQRRTEHRESRLTTRVIGLARTKKAAFPLRLFPRRRHTNSVFEGYRTQALSAHNLRERSLGADPAPSLVSAVRPLPALTRQKSRSATPYVDRRRSTAHDECPQPRNCDVRPAFNERPLFALDRPKLLVCFRPLLDPVPRAA